MADQDMSEELKASMGKPSSFHTGDTNPVTPPAAPATPAAPKSDADSFYEHVKSFFTKKQSEPTHGGKGINEIIDAAAKGAPTTPEYGE
jgi:hypothetical protein